MNFNNWKSVWNNRDTSHGIFNLENLIKLDGYDKGAGQVNVKDWEKYAYLIVKYLNIQNGNSVFEVGCGSGALLTAIKKYVNVTIAGLDYSEKLIEIVKKNFPKDEFLLMEAKDMNTSKKYDFVISNGVFHYFDWEYATIVMEKMISSLSQGGSILILDIPNIFFKKELENLRLNKYGIDYLDKYSDLTHNYYSKEQFIDFATLNKLESEIITGFIPNNDQSSFRFCVKYKVN